MLNNPSKSVLLTLPSHDCQEPTRLPAKQVTETEVGVLADHDTALLIGRRDHFRVRAAVSVGQVRYMDGIVSHLGQQPTEVFGELGIDEESHAASRGVTRRVPKAMAANSSAARRSSRSRSG